MSEGRLGGTAVDGVGVAARAPVPGQVDGREPQEAAGLGAELRSMVNSP